MVEMFLIIGIIAALIIGVFLLYPSVRASRQAIKEQANLQHIAGNTKHLFLHRSYLGLNNDIANPARVFPTDMNEGNFQAGQEILSSWGGEVAVGPSSDVPGLFQVTYSEVPDTVCLHFVRGIQTSYERIFINTTTVRDILSTPQVTSTPVQLVDLCDSDDPITVRIETR